MFASPTLARYLGRQFLAATGLTLALCLWLAFLFDLAEVLRRTADKDNVSFAQALTLTLLKLPALAGQILPFVVLLGAVAAFVKLTRTHELVIARAAGVSVWQILAAPLAIVLLAGIIVITVYNPLAAAFLARYEQMEAQVVSGRSDALLVAGTGLWVRQGDAGGQSVIHALKIGATGTSAADAGAADASVAGASVPDATGGGVQLELQNITVFLYGPGGGFTGRVDASRARLEEGYWDMAQAWITRPGAAPVFQERYRQPTPLTPQQVRERFTAPETIPLWELNRFIRLASAAGLSVQPYRVHYYALLATPVLLCAMTVLGAAFGLRGAGRRGGMGQLILTAIFAGFILYFLTSLMHALGSSGALPAPLAAWAPALAGLCLGLALLLHWEDG